MTDTQSHAVMHRPSHTVCQTDSAPVCPCHTQTHRHTLWLPGARDSESVRLSRRYCDAPTLRRRDTDTPPVARTLRWTRIRGGGEQLNCSDINARRGPREIGKAPRAIRQVPREAQRGPRVQKSAHEWKNRQKSTKIDKNRHENSRGPLLTSRGPLLTSRGTFQIARGISRAPREASRTHRHTDTQTHRH